MNSNAYLDAQENKNTMKYTTYKNSNLLFAQKQNKKNEKYLIDPAILAIGTAAAKYKSNAAN